MLLPALAFAAVQAFEAGDARRFEASTRMQVAALTNADAVERGLAELTEAAQLLAASPSLHHGDVVAFRLSADRVAHTQSVGVVLRDRSGVQAVATRVAPDAALPSLPPEDPVARSAIDARHTYVSSVFTTGMVDPFMTRIVVPASLGTRDGYAVEIEIGPRVVASWLSHMAALPSSLVLVTDRMGRVVASSHDLDSYAGRSSAGGDFAPLQGSSAAWTGTALDATPLTGAYTHLEGSGWNVSVGVPASMLTEQFRHSLQWLAGSVALLVVAGVALSAWLAQQIEHGAAVLARSAQRLGLGETVPATSLAVGEFVTIGAALTSASQENARRTRTERQLAADLARAGRLSAVAAMASGLAHELNQPLAAASNFLAAAGGLLAAKAGDADVQEAMAEASAQVLRAGDIVRRLRDFLSGDAPELSEQPLAPLIEHAAQGAWRLAADSASILHFDLDRSVTALVDAVQIQQVVANLVRNAAEALATSKEPNGREAWVRLARTQDGGCAVSVVDSGPGFDPSRQHRLFDVFGGSGKPGGLGVGLAICDIIVAVHGGVLLAGDPEGRGAAFTFTLPVEGGDRTHHAA